MGPGADGEGTGGYRTVTSDEDDSRAPSVNRRRVLRGAAAVAAAGLAVGSAGARPTESATDCRGPSAPADYPYVEGETREVHGDFPESTDELAVFVNGWFAEEYTWPGEDQGYLAAENAAANGYTADAINSSSAYSVVTWAWDSGDPWALAKRQAERQGTALADWLATTYRPNNPEACIRLVGHSLGARVLASCLQTLDERGCDPVRSTTFLGGAIDDHSVATDGQWGPHIAAATDRLDNYFKTDDRVLDDAY